MRRRRQWLEDAVLSPTSRRRLDNSPTGDIVSQFGRALDSVNITLQLPPRIIDLTQVDDVEEVKDDAASDQARANADEDTEEELIDESITVDETIAQTVAQAYGELLARISPPRTPSPPLPPPPPPVPQNVVNLYRNPTQRSRAPQVHTNFHSTSTPADTMVVRIRSRRNPQLVVRLPGGGFSYPSSPSYSRSPLENPRRTQSLGWRGVSAAVPPRRNRRLDRIRRQLRMDLQERSQMEVLPANNNRSPAMLWSTLASSLRANPGDLLRSQPRRDAPPRPISSFIATEEMGVPEGKCGICLEDFKVGTRISIIPCQPEGVSGAKDHVFCYECIYRWVSACRGQRTCPLCRGVW